MGCDLAYVRYVDPWTGEEETMPFGTVNLLAGSRGAIATTYVVRPDGTGDFPTIQAAIDAAVNGDVIELGSGVFTGAGNRDVSFRGKTITVRSQSDDPTTCTIDCQGTPQDPHRGFLFESLERPETTLRGVTITGGCAPAGQYGGAITIDPVSGLRPGGTIENCRILGNRSCSIYVFASSVPAPTISNCLVAGNTGPIVAGIYWVSSVWAGQGTIDGCTITGNHAEIGAGGLAVVGPGDIQISRTIIWGICAPGSDEVHFSDGYAVFSCCVVDSSGVGSDGLSGWSWGNSVFVNPLFCEPASCDAAPTVAGDYHVDAASICLPGASPCGDLIGALGQGCSGTVPVAERSWGEIKAQYRR